MSLTTVKLFATAVIWGGTFIAGRMLGPEIAPLSASFLRFVAANLFLVPLWLLTEGRPKRPDTGTALLVLGLGATGVFGYNVFFLWGLKSVPAARAAMIVAGNPVFIALLSRLFFKEPLGRVKAMGVCLCILGASVVIGRGNPLEVFSGAVTLGDAAIVGAMLTWVAYSLLGKRVMGRLTPLAAVTLSCLAGMCMLLPPALAEGLAAQAAGLSWKGWAAIVYLGFFGTGLGFLWFYQGIQRLGASRAAVFINFVPVSAAVLGAALLGEPVDASIIAGGALVLTGVALANRPPRAR
ncbi:4-amino-4-deoxy-L-arabinose-phosphoundecaprenol flippase subunit ArnE [Fundidesulfovibrio magnetotacticus]|uniref:4-amino-4-deoxy-L-arabinose-phosphoundecaprenol flippase subunit ArnE n=1 Tax=Fundidesulfovibrio magnetotacticus TaxID=2730080 RepID=A0A6V8LLS3_9BACT|nr:DMT family transporter [Fundidesulfovibrio magnetotacticus]GFK92654.1 4-amino-4-deoxy-L-arabinose-phosphoundecaprenol flippase subunit ArnE [Fundidesulfovibrio magnetotacticus]